jgi:regulator of sigma E protease
MLLTLIVFFLILSLLVLIHEFGHFFTAKKFGIKVEEFGFGLPPRVFGKQRGETIYSINALPFGGFVKLLGEESPETEEGEAPETTQLDPRSFSAKQPWKRAIVLVAGVTMNVLLGVALYYVFFSFTGFKSLTLPLLTDYQFRFGEEERMQTVISGFSDDSKADDAGLRVGEAILEINGQPVYTFDSLKGVLADKPNQKVKVLVMDVIDLDKPVRSVEMETVSNEQGEGILGTYLTEAVVLSYQGSNKLFAGFMHSYNVMAYSTHTFKDLIKTAFVEKDVAPVSSSVSGPVGIFGVVGGIIDYGGKEALLGLIDLIALLSLSLAFLNIMPFPALDGGRLVFVIYEGITRKKVSPHLENSLHKWGMLVLLSLIVLVTIKDVSSIFGS